MSILDQAAGQSSTADTSQTANTDPAGAGAAGAGAAAGAATPSWWEAFPDDLKASPNVTRYKSPEEAARALDIATKRLGTPAEQLLKIPTKPDDEAGWSELYGKLGKPATAADYQLTLDDTASDADKAFVEKFREVAHKANFSQSQMAAAIGYLNETTAAAVKADGEAQAAKAAEVTAALNTEWGAKAPIYAREIPKLIEELGGKDAIAALNADGMGSSKALLQLLAKVSDMRAEPGKLPGGGAAPADTGAMTPAQASAARQVLEGDPEKSKALWDNTHPMHAAIVAERNKLFALEHPPKPA